MKPSTFLKERLAAFSIEVAGAATVLYFVLSPGQKAGFTGTLNESAAYPSIGVDLPALVEFSPSDALRKKIGAEIKFDAMLQIVVQHLTDNSITLKIGDAFVLPESSDKYYIKKIIPSHQTDTGHIVKLIAVSRQQGRR